MTIRTQDSHRRRRPVGPPGMRTSLGVPTLPPTSTVREASSPGDLRAVQELRHRLLGSFAGVVAGFEERRGGLVEAADAESTHLAVFDHRDRAIVAVRLDEVRGSIEHHRSLPMAEMANVGVDLSDGRRRSISDRLHVTPGVDVHLVIRLLAAMMEEARRRGWAGDLCHCDPEHFEIRRTLGYRTLGVFAPGVDGRYPTRELMYLEFPRSRAGMG